LPAYQLDGGAIEVEPRAGAFALPNILVERESCACPTTHAWWPVWRLGGTGVPNYDASWTGPDLLNYHHGRLPERSLFCGGVEHIYLTVIFSRRELAERNSHHHRQHM
jgi:hypothetical protein